jgi:hypothetical protein
MKSEPDRASETSLNRVLGFNTLDMDEAWELFRDGLHLRIRVMERRMIFKPVPRAFPRSHCFSSFSSLPLTDG